VAEWHQHESGPGVERPAAAVVGEIDDRGIILQGVGSHRHANAANEHGDADMTLSLVEQLVHAVDGKRREGLDETVMRAVRRRAASTNRVESANSASRARS